MLVVPMLHDDSLVGVVTLSKLGLHQFDEDDLRLLLILADQAATAFTGAAHLAEAHRLAADLRQLLDMSSALSRSLDPVAVADLMAEHLARAVGAGQAQISLWDAARATGSGRWAATRPRSASPCDETYDLGGFPLTRRGPRGARSSPRWTSTTRDADAGRGRAPAERAAIGGLLMLPLVAKDRAIGLVELTFDGRPDRRRAA